MARDIEPLKSKDWSELNVDKELFSGIDLSMSDANFGIHEYEGKLYTGGFVGVGRIYKYDQTPLYYNGKELILIISSRFDMNPWKMLEKVMGDDEYENYVEELKKNGKSLFEVYFNQPLVRLAQNELNDGELLYALSYIHSCYYVCRKGLKNTMVHKEDNYKSKVKGRIDVKKNTSLNTCRGRNDRFYCKYIDFTIDNVENRILKSTLKKCISIIRERFEINSESARRIAFCINAFRHVSDVILTATDFNSISISGLYIYYNPALLQAMSIFNQRYYSCAAEDGRVSAKCVHTIPYMINMETLFEFYARTILKEAINNDKRVIDKYAKKWYLISNAAEGQNIERGIHLTQYCIPDIVVRDIVTDCVLAVLDAKYKPHNRANREDSYQLLSYALLTGVNKCGFVFPGTETKLKHMHTNETDHLLLNAPLIAGLKYYELTLGDTQSETDLEKIFH